ncbi:hypothetical protein EMCRGX_G023969 [Ephydatia muelleri]
MSASLAWCPSDAELARTNIGWSTLTGHKVRNGSHRLSQAELDSIRRVIARAEAFERGEQERIRKLWLTVCAAAGDGILQCAVCGCTVLPPATDTITASSDASPDRCRRCEKRVGLCCLKGSLCKRCYSIQQVWLKSGAWFTNGDVNQLKKCSMEDSPQQPECTNTHPNCLVSKGFLVEVSTSHQETAECSVPVVTYGAHPAHDQDQRVMPASLETMTMGGGMSDAGTSDHLRCDIEWEEDPQAAGVAIPDPANAKPTTVEGVDLRSFMWKRSNARRRIRTSRHLQGTHQEGTHQEGTHLEGTHQEGTHQEETHQEGTHQEGTHQEGTHQEGTHQEGTHQEGTHQEETHQEGTHQEGTHQEGTHQEETHLEGTHQEGTHLEGTHQEGTHQEGTHLQGTPSEPKVENSPALSVEENGLVIEKPSTPKGLAMNFDIYFNEPTSQADENITTCFSDVHTSAPPSAAQPSNAPPIPTQPSTAPPTTAQSSDAPPIPAIPSNAQPSIAPPTAAQPSIAPPTTAQSSNAPPTQAQPSSAPPIPAKTFKVLPTPAQPSNSLPRWVKPLSDNRGKVKGVLHHQTFAQLPMSVMSVSPEHGLFGSIELTLEYLPEALQMIVTILRCKGLCGGSEHCHPYAVLSLIPDPKLMQQFETETLYQCLDPEFNQSFTFTNITQQMVEVKSLSVMVMNRDTSTSDDLLGTCKVALWEAIPNKVVSLKKILDQSPNVADTVYLSALEGEVPSKGKVTCSFSYSMETLTVHVAKATITLTDMNSNGHANCYIKCSLDDGWTRQKKKIKAIASSLHLTFDEDMLFYVSMDKLTHCTLKIQVWTARRLLVPSTCIGGTELQTIPLWRQWIKNSHQIISSTYTLQ